MDLENDKLIEDWGKVIDNELTKNVFISSYWKRFVGLYVSIFKKKDDAELIFILHEILDKMLKMDVIPIFESSNQFSKYIKVSLEHKYKLQKLKAYGENIVVNETEENPIDSLVDPTSNNILKMDMLLSDLELILTKNQLDIVVLLLRGYSRKHIGNMLGLSLSAVNNRIYCVQEKIKNYIFL